MMDQTDKLALGDILTDRFQWLKQTCRIGIDRPLSIQLARALSLVGHIVWQHPKTVHHATQPPLGAFQNIRRDLTTTAEFGHDVDHPLPIGGSHRCTRRAVAATAAGKNPCVRQIKRFLKADQSLRFFGTMALPAQ